MNNQFLLLPCLLFLFSTAFSQSKTSTDRLKQIKWELAQKIDTSLSTTLDEFEQDLHNTLTEIKDLEIRSFADTLGLIKLKETQKYYQEALSRSETFYTKISYLIGFLTLILTIVIGTGIYSQIKRAEDVRREAQESTQKEERLNNRIKDADTKFDEIQRIREQLITFINKEKEELARKEGELNNQLKVFEERNRMAFSSLHNDLIEFCMDMSENSNLKGGGDEALMDYHRSTLFEHQSILQLYSLDIDKVHKTLQSLSEVGTMRSLPHLEYLLSRLENWEDNEEENIDLINQVKKLTYRTIVNIEENNEL